MERIKLAEDFEVSRVVHGYWRLTDWKLTDQDLLELIRKVMEFGITTFDHADIYGDYTCERLFGNALVLDKSLRDKMEIVTKCGIRRWQPSHGVGKNYYDYSYDHITHSVENSLRNFQTEYIDLLLLHRPSPFIDPEEVARAFDDLRSSGKVRYFGVSNFPATQFEALNKYLNNKLVTNQVEISPLCLEHFNNGNIDFFLKEKVYPMAWSPLAGGKIFNPTNSHELHVKETIAEIAKELQVPLDTTVYSWLLKHPAKIIPIVGSGKLERVKAAVDAMEVQMSLEQWFRIYIAGNGKNLP